MKYLESYNVYEDTKSDPKVKEIINDSFIDLIQNKMGISTQIQRRNNIILIYITGPRIRALVNKDFSFEDIKDSVNHLISSFKIENHPIISARYMVFGEWKTWDKLNYNVDDIFDGRNIDSITSFELKFKYR